MKKDFNNTWNATRVDIEPILPILPTCQANKELIPGGEHD